MVIAVSTAAITDSPIAAHSTAALAIVGGLEAQARPRVRTDFEVVVVPSGIRRAREAGAREGPRQALEQALARRPRLVPVGEMEAAAQPSHRRALEWLEFTAEVNRSHPRLPSSPGPH